jgi:hypothetical protein
MLAPYFSGLLASQSDLGHPAGAVLATRCLRDTIVSDSIVSDFIVSDFPPESGLWRWPQLLQATCSGCAGVFTDIVD